MKIETINLEKSIETIETQSFVPESQLQLTKVLSVQSIILWHSCKSAIDSKISSENIHRRCTILIVSVCSTVARSKPLAVMYYLLNEQEHYQALTAIVALVPIKQ